MDAVYRDLRGKRVLISGGASGIGQATVQRFLDEGATVNVVDNNAAALEAAWGDVGGGQVKTHQCDVTDLSQMMGVYSEIEETQGGIDFVFANAGISLRHSFLEMTPEEWRRVIDVNLHGVYNTVMPAAKMMMNAGAGAIAVMGSTNGMSAHRYYCDYNVSKAGVIMLARTMALELAPVVRVNAICPGYVLTPMQRSEYTDEMLAKVNEGIPLKRHADPGEVAALVAFLASEQSRYITGIMVPIDGGETA